MKLEKGGVFLPKKNVKLKPDRSKCSVVPPMWKTDFFYSLMKAL
jgi:hypothetical protein